MSDRRHPLGRSTEFRSRLATEVRYRPENVETIEQLRRDHFAAKFAEDVVLRLAEGPALTAEQRAALAALFAEDDR